MTYHTGNQLVDPKFLFEKCHLQPSMHVADFGCGRTGHITIPAASILGERGIIYAIDILKETLQLVEKRAQSAGLVNVHTIWSDVETVGATAVPAGTLDLVFLVNILSHVQKRTNVLEEAKRLLKEKARLIIVDWRKAGLPMCPKEGQRVNFGEIIDWAKGHDFVVQEEFEVGDYHEGLVLYRNF